jgi:L-rhamnose mutarotase
MRYCLALDLKDDPIAIENYKKWHLQENFRPEITQSIRDAGVIDMQIYLIGNRLFMIMEVDERFNFEEKTKMDAANPEVQDWENFVSQFQQRLPWEKEGQKWVLMEKIYELDKRAW